MGARGRWAAAVGLVVVATGAAAVIGLRAEMDRKIAMALESALGAGTLPRLEIARVALWPWGPMEIDGALTLTRTAGYGLTGQIVVSGSVVLGIGSDGVTVTPSSCLTVRADGMALNQSPLALPEAGALCEEESGPALNWRPDVGPTLAARLTVPRLASPTQAWAVEGIRLSFRHAPGQLLTLDAAATLHHTPAEQPVKPQAKPVLAPLTVAVQAARATPTAAWTLSGAVRALDGGLTIHATATHDPLSNSGRLDLRSDPLRVGGAGVALAALSPRLARVAQAVTGRLTAKARLTWTGEPGTGEARTGEWAVRSSGDVRIEGGGATLGPVRVAGVNGVVALSSLWPPVVPDGQRLAVALLDVGIPLTDGVIRFGYGRDRRVDVDEAVWRWGGGTLKAEPFELSPSAPNGLVTLRADGVDLGALLDLIRVDGVAANGRLSGRLPVRIGNGRVVLDGAVFDAAGAGTLRYAPAEPPPGLSGPEGSPTQLLLGALSDFRYDSLRLTLEGEAGGELRAGLSVRGANPAFYDGHPVSLNLTLSGALDRIVRQSLDTYRIPDAVRDRMTGFDQPKDP